MQDLLLAQKRGRPAYFFQHLDLELRPRGECDQTSAAGPAVLARFEAEWNSVRMNKMRSFNILRAVHPGECTVLLQLDRQQGPSPQRRRNAAYRAYQAALAWRETT